MKTTLEHKTLEDVARELGKANATFKAAYPGDSGARQPVHVVYGGAHLFKATTAERLGTLARKTLAEYAPDAASLAEALKLNLDVGSQSTLAEDVYARTVTKLSREPVEDFRIDFEDGYGNRPEAEEDGHAVAAALEVAKGMAAGSLPPFIGIRLKPLTEELQRRQLAHAGSFPDGAARANRRTPPGTFCGYPAENFHAAAAGGAGQGAGAIRGGSEAAARRRCGSRS